MKLGPEMPYAKYGHCGYSPVPDDPSVPTCDAPAITHLLVELNADGSTFTAFACLEHDPVARRMLQPRDYHPCDYPCTLPGSTWQVSTPERPGFCFDPDETEALAAELAQSLELTGAR